MDLVDLCGSGWIRKDLEGSRWREAGEQGGPKVESCLKQCVFNTFHAKVIQNQCISNISEKK